MWAMLIGGIVPMALAEPTTQPATDSGPRAELGIGGAYVAMPFRDAQVSARRQQGAAGAFVVSLDGLGLPRLDRAELHAFLGGGPGWSWRGIQLRNTIAPDVATLGPVTIRVGAQLDTGGVVRRWRDAVTWRAQVALGPAVALRLPLVEGGSAAGWSTELVAASPLLGVLGRPGWASSLQGFSLSSRDLAFASLHNHRAGQLQASLLWERGDHASLRLQGELSGRVVIWRHRLAEVAHSVSLLLYWRL